MIDLSTKSFLEFDDFYKIELETLLKNLLKLEFNISEDAIRDIIVSGSRVILAHKKLFKKDSDLDVGIIIDSETFDKYFYPIDDLHFSKRLIEKFKKEFPDKKLGKLSGFSFYGIHVSPFIRKENGDVYKNIYLGKYNLTYYSYAYKQLIHGNMLHEIDYYTHLKSRLEPYTYCYVCGEWKNSPNILEFRIITEQQRDEDIDHFYLVKQGYVCNRCLKKITQGPTKLFENIRRD